MKLKNITTCAAALFSALLFSACSEVAEDERFTPIEPVKVARRVLIEDFTGQKCVNCPDATALIETLQEAYGADTIIAVGIHSGFYAERTPLRTDEGDYLYEQFGIESQPSGMINRGGVLTSLLDWPTQVGNALAAPTTANIAVSNTYVEASRNLNIDVTISSSVNATGKLNVWLTEDGIVSLQYMPDGSRDANYVHNHVFRAAATDIDGESVTLAFDEPQTKTYSIQIKDEWVPENMSVVAFVEGDDGVLQVVKVAVK